VKLVIEVEIGGNGLLSLHDALEVITASMNDFGYHHNGTCGVVEPSNGALIYTPAGAIVGNWDVFSASEDDD
jgi:hypothetical protein